MYLSAQMLSALAAAHDQGVIHRDLKPANVMIDGRGVAHLTDFGLAVGENTAAARVSGTPPYMAPEQLEGDPIGRRTDVYAFGLIFYEMITGRRVFTGAPVDEIARAHVLPKTRPSVLRPESRPGLADRVCSRRFCRACRRCGRSGLRVLRQRSASHGHSGNLATLFSAAHAGEFDRRATGRCFLRLWFPPCDVSGMARISASAPLATVVVVAVIGLVFADWNSEPLALEIIGSIAVTSLFAWLLLRFGLLALTTCYAVSM